MNPLKTQNSSQQFSFYSEENFEVVPPCPLGVLYRYRPIRGHTSDLSLTTDMTPSVVYRYKPPRNDFQPVHSLIISNI